MQIFVKIFSLIFPSTSKLSCRKYSCRMQIRKTEMYSLFLELILNLFSRKIQQNYKLNLNCQNNSYRRYTIYKNFISIKNRGFYKIAKKFMGYPVRHTSTSVQHRKRIESLDVLLIQHDITSIRTLAIECIGIFFESRVFLSGICTCRKFNFPRLIQMQIQVAAADTVMHER